MDGSEDPPEQEAEPDITNPVPLQLWLIVGLMAVIEVLFSASDAGLIADNLRLDAIEYGAFWPQILTGDLQPLLPAQQVYMFLSYAFLHISFSHLIWNVVLILAIGKFISDQTGPWPMVGLFTTCTVAGSALFFLIGSHQLPAIGASASAFGFIGLWQYWHWQVEDEDYRSFNPVIKATLVMGVLNVITALLTDGNVAWVINAAGSMVGIASGPLMTWIIRRRLGLE